ncbi:putative HTLV-1-related endogenous sequence [Schistocerca gregaria]|uniref:putative HTLV-1-related endogenous sequence n=1 Tax=Schistocerca gregaria TaxID=7010 RepID=UPI00211E03C6|nr:putative HTLV-1-related endogenous sequence [Schistocerca gregaria]
MSGRSEAPRGGSDRAAERRRDPPASIPPADTAARGPREPLHSQPPPRHLRPQRADAPPATPPALSAVLCQFFVQFVLGASLQLECASEGAENGGRGHGTGRGYSRRRQSVRRGAADAPDLVAAAEGGGRPRLAPTSPPGTDQRAAPRRTRPPSTQRRSYTYSTE